MNRRHLNATLALGAVAATLGPLIAQAQTPKTASRPAPRSRIGMLIHPDMILLDLVGPLTVFSLMMAETHLVWKSREPVLTDVGIQILPTDSFETCPADLDVLFVPGGLTGTVALMEDRTVLDFLADRGSRARYVTSVCTGSLALGAAGLLRGYRATSHWYVRDLLPHFGATEDSDRVIVDRNRITGAGVTAGIDFALRLCSLMCGDDYARRVELLLEYAPEPLFGSGRPETAGPEVAAEILARRAPVIAAAKAAAEHASARMR
jgi:transcriptional regulator GlxA family with amidase domain